MIVNRNNYETFFLLYADDELRADERTAVEDFISQNEDLRGELEMTLAAIITAEDLLFEEKQTLYKNTFVAADLQEKLLLKIDNELPTREIAIVGKVLAENEFAEKEHQLLLATKLDAYETILFKNKELLYKKEQNNVIVIRLVRWAAAAILIGFGLFFGIIIFKNNWQKSYNSVVVIKGKSKDTGHTKTDNNIAANLVTKKPYEVINTKEDIGKTQIDTRSAVSKIQNKEIKQKDNVTKATKDTAYEGIAIIKTTAPVEKLKSLLITNNTETAIATLKIKDKVKQAPANENIVPLENTYAQAVSFTEDEKSNNKIFYMDEDDVKRSKVGGIFKKFKRLVERTAKIKTGNSLKIAGFEIAAR